MGLPRKLCLFDEGVTRLLGVRTLRPRRKNTATNHDKILSLFLIRSQNILLKNIPDFSMSILAWKSLRRWTKMASRRKNMAAFEPTKVTRARRGKSRNGGKTTHITWLNYTGSPIVFKNMFMQPVKLSRSLEHNCPIQILANICKMVQISFLFHAHNFWTLDLHFNF